MTPEMTWLAALAALAFVAIIGSAASKRSSPADEEYPGLELGPADELSPAPAGSALTPTGWLTLLAGVVVTIISLSMDISARGYGDVVNMDAISRRAMVFEAGLALAVIGVVLATAGYVVTVLRESTRGSRRD